MGSISKPPKAPTIQYVTPSVTSQPSTPEPVITEPVKTDEELASEARTASLLRRSRGRFGTITSSFRGFLDSAFNNDDKQKSKTLLGE